MMKNMHPEKKSTCSLYNGGNHYKVICVIEILVILLLVVNMIAKKTVVQTMSGESENEIKKIAITFDDGPHPIYTPKLLDGLEKRRVKASFFVTGENAQLHPELIKRMHEDGHLIGNHTYSHIQLTSSNREIYRQELIKTNKVISEITKADVLYVRPPYGIWDKRLESELNMFPVLWTVDPLDWCTSSVSCIVRETLKDVGENDIILMHDYYDTSVTAALQVIDELLAKGYTFVTVDEILFD